MATPPPAPLKRPGGARPIPTRVTSPPKISIPVGNVPGANVDQANENGWQIPPPHLPSVPIPSPAQKSPIPGDAPAPSRPIIPSLALNPMGRSSSASSSRPKLSLSGFSTPIPSPGINSTPSSQPTSAIFASPLSSSSLDYSPAPGMVASVSAPAPRGRPSLLNAPGANLVPSRSSTPSLKLAIPGLGGGGGGGSGLNLSNLGGGSAYSNHDYPLDSGEDDSLDSALRTPTAGSMFEDRNPTLIARGRGRDDDEEEESAYGYGRIGRNGAGGASGGGDAMSSMTEDIRQALSRSRFDTSSSLNSASSSGSRTRTRDSSRTSSRSSSVARGHRLSEGYTAADMDSEGGMPNLDGLSIGDTPPSASSAGVSERYPASDGEGGSGCATPISATKKPEMGSRSGSGYGSADKNAAGVGRAVERAFIPIVDPSKLRVLKRLGEGSGGAVEMVEDPATGQIMAKKVIARTANPAMHRQLLRELEILNSCASPYIVDHYGSFLAEHDTQIGILMEFCEGGSLDSILQKMKLNGMRCSEHVLGRIAASVLRGLDYLHERRIIHRDIKPSNILITKSGQCKLCDFGVSGELVDSIAGTFTGTSYYMAPERIQGQPYSIRADVWSLGLSLHEVAHLRFPFPPEGESEYVAPIELLSYIVTAPVPEMVDDPTIGRVWSEGIKSFMKLCLIRSGTERPYPRELLPHPFIVTSEAKKVNMAKWVAAVLSAGGG